MRTQRDTAAGVIVYHRDGSRCRFLLLLSRLTRRPLWEFPKGGVDGEETVLEAGFRELHEETGLGPDDVRQVPGFQRTERYRFTVGGGTDRVMIRKQVTYFLAEALHERVRLSAKETIDYAWVELPEALRRVRYAERRRILEAAAETAGCAAAAIDEGGLE
jgi:8-oxo-dGTP pyrophosphatase MutT (NUDIX family)